MRKIVALVLTLAPLVLSAQQGKISGEVVDSDANPMVYATVALLNPTDSTIAHFCITNPQGRFELSRITPGEYLLQISFIGYTTLSRRVALPLPGNGTLGTLVMRAMPTELDAVRVTADRVPLLIKNDTVEYNAAAFKTKPDAVAEDLLRKLPGIEVDRAGNIKAMGESVSRVLVDGKEFFGNDPTVATKNLPAESVNRVQVFDKKTDEAELLGIDDSEYGKTINFVLKENMKSTVFGDVRAGGGVEDFYQGNARMYRFTEGYQLAMLGMLNNVNKPGFSIRDYIDFNGGIKSLMGGSSRVSLSSDGGLPVDFGQTVTGELTSGAGGVNYSYELSKDNSLNISYMGHGSQKDDITSTSSRNFTESGLFGQRSSSTKEAGSTNHLFNVGWRNRAGDRQRFMLNGIATLSNSSSETASFTENLANEALVNSLDGNMLGSSRRFNASLDGSWMRRGFGEWKMLKLTGASRYSKSLSKSDWRNVSQLAGSPLPVEDVQFSESNSRLWQHSVAVAALRRIGTGLFLEPTVGGGLALETLRKEQGNALPPAPVPVDSLSPAVEQRYQWLKPCLLLRKNTKRHKLNIGLGLELGQYTNGLNGGAWEAEPVLGLLPQLSWDYEYKTNHRLGVSYQTSNSLPTAMQLMPIINASNPFAIYYGNRHLKPEYGHNFNLHWYLFDQFSFTSVFATLNGSYTENKINQSLQVSTTLAQQVRLVNTPSDIGASASINFSTPVKLLGLKVGVNLKERWNQGIGYVNGVENVNTSQTHQVGLKLENRRKEKWDAEIGGTLILTDTRYSIQRELNRSYNSHTAYGEVCYTPTPAWHFRITADITSYSAQSFGGAVTVPLLSAEANYHFLANNRAMLSLEAYDLLNRNTGVTRVSEYNYISETSSKMLGRYFMLSFKYSLNKLGGERSGGIRFQTLP